jgi:hypothetical protein
MVGAPVGSYPKSLPEVDRPPIAVPPAAYAMRAGVIASPRRARRVENYSSFWLWSKFATTGPAGLQIVPAQTNCGSACWELSCASASRPHSQGPT